MRRILTSLLVIGIVGVAAFGASRAFFSDTETSSGNVLAAGAIDLLVGNTSYVTDEDGKLVASPSTTWSLRDLTVEKFFNFFDLKPGDEGENTISLHVNNNDAYACAHVAISQDIDNGFTDPEDEMFAGAGDGTSTGDLDEELYFVFWGDDGDNVYENNEDILVQGPVSNIVSTGGTLTIADSSTSPLSASTTKYIGSYFCYGNVTSTAGLTPGTGGPDTRSSGFTCDGAAVTNRSQTDMLIGDLSFYAVQSRNNNGFTCSTVAWPTPDSTTVLSFEVNAQNASQEGWFFWNDENDTPGPFTTFEAGPGTPPLGTGSAFMTVSGTQRHNFATNMFGGTKLNDITDLSFSTHQDTGQTDNERAIYLHFNIDFDGSDSWQNRLVYVPRENGTVQQGVWQNWDALDGGNAMWWWSGFAGNGNQWPDGNTNPYRTWNSIVTQWPNARMRVSDTFLGFRAGEPYNDGFTGNLDNVRIGIENVVREYDLEN